MPYMGTDGLASEWVQRIGGGEWIENWVEAIIRYGVEQEIERIASVADGVADQTFTGAQIASVLRGLDPWRDADGDPRPVLTNDVPFPSRGD